MGAAKRREKAVLTQALQAMVVDTSGGRIHVQWDPTARIPRPGLHGQRCAERTTDLLCRVYGRHRGHHRALRILARQRPLNLHLELQQPERARQTRCPGHPTAPALPPPRAARIDRVTAGFRFNTGILIPIWE